MYAIRRNCLGDIILWREKQFIEFDPLPLKSPEFHKPSPSTVRPLNLMLTVYSTNHLETSP